MASSGDASAALAHSSMAGLDDGMEQLLIEAEQAIIAYHGAQLTFWANEQRLSLQTATGLDLQTLSAQQALCDNVTHSVEAEIRNQREQQAEVAAKAKDIQEELEKQVAKELRSIRETRTTEAAGAISAGAEQVRSFVQQYEAAQWESLDSSLQALCWRHAMDVRAACPGESVADLWDVGWIQPRLQVEVDGWTRSQQSDLEHLREDLEAEFAPGFRTLEEKLQGAQPDIEGVATEAAGSLQTKAEEERRALFRIEEQLRDEYEPQLEALNLKCERDYEKFDRELQNTYKSTLKCRFDGASRVRQLKFALCAWRLDYQRVYNERHKAAMQIADELTGAESGSKFDACKAARQSGPAQLEATRRSVSGLWDRTSTPVPELKRFAGRVAEAAVLAGHAEVVLNGYQEELKKYGASFLVEHAREPEQLKCWLAALRRP